MSELDSRNEEAVEMLHEKGLTRFAEVWTADQVQVGEAIRLHYRTHNVNPALKMYQSYLESKSIEMGGSVFIPTDYIADYDPATGRVTLSVKIKTVKHETWERVPDFVAHHASQVEELPA